MKKFYIYAPSYNEKSGGCVVLHRLCHLLNSFEDCQAFLVPNVPEKLSVNSLRSFFDDVLLLIKLLVINIFSETLFKTNPNWNTPVVKKIKIKIKDLETSVIVYPEITNGNPLCAKNVVRWLLHQPGYFTKCINYGVNELYFKFNSAIEDFNFSLSHTSINELKIIYYPLEYYNLEGATNNKGSCHAIRKGKGKVTVHPIDSVLIDEIDHKTVSAIFKSSKRFISYDDYTAYSIFAVLCGCESIVVPSPGISKYEWYNNPTDRYGIAYGFSNEELNIARESKNKVYEHVIKEHKKSLNNARNFAIEAYDFFDL
ncbi:hypothetical protein VT06_14735 [Arsukibacterium sp. MJ3]|uniref:hypothetical protein n=1 Tax=Arsukibacterium sp. MJ3 TaxID=1632859 RepID=UPI000627440C|nr:hypothetical protein [Arsukibacterium sp. MJ3]KKO47846.1 hypothetical protein VT06_14735 [Arsukibacterium sp. MJ3]